MADAMRREAASARRGQIVYSPEAQLGRILVAFPARLIRDRANPRSAASAASAVSGLRTRGRSTRRAA